MIERECFAGPFGDECSMYNVSFSTGTTVHQFVKKMLKQYPQEWGEIYICGFDKPVATYKRKRCLILKDTYEQYKDKKIVKILGHGGWSNMDYQLILEKDDEENNKELLDYSRCYILPANSFQFS